MRLLPPLFWRTTDWPLPRPLTLPPTLNVLTTQLTATFVTLLAATVPEPLVTVQVLVAGFASTVTL